MQRAVDNRRRTPFRPPTAAAEVTPHSKNPTGIAPSTVPISLRFTVAWHPVIGTFSGEGPRRGPIEKQLPAPVGSGAGACHAPVPMETHEIPMNLALLQDDQVTGNDAAKLVHLDLPLVVVEGADALRPPATIDTIGDLSVRAEAHEDDAP